MDGCGRGNPAPEGRVVTHTRLRPTRKYAIVSSCFVRGGRGTDSDPRPKTATSAEPPAPSGTGRGFCASVLDSSLRPAVRASAHHLDLAWPPGLVEKGLQGTVEPQDDEPAFL